MPTAQIMLSLLPVSAQTTSPVVTGSLAPPFFGNEKILKRVTVCASMFLSTLVLCGSDSY